LVLFATGHWVVALVALVMAISVFWTWLPVRLHSAMRLAMSTRRYDRARRLLSALRFMIRSGPASILLGDLLVTEEARIHAGAGQMERALEVLGQLRDGGPREELYQLSIPSLYDSARDYEGMLTAQRELAAHRPNDANPHLDLALLLALRFGAHGAARESLGRAKDLPKTDLAAAFGQLAEGVVLFLEGQGEHAVECLRTARAYFETQPPSMTRGLVALATAYLARSLALLGRDEEAEAELRRASPVLLDEQEYELIDASWADLLRDRR
jgi:tetratricopeptide (TPR) repeat protein